MSFRRVVLLYILKASHAHPQSQQDAGGSARFKHEYTDLAAALAALARAAEGGGREATRRPARAEEALFARGRCLVTTVRVTARGTRVSAAA